MNQDSSETLSRLRWPIYFVAMGLIIIPLVDFALSVLPVDPGNLRWRWSTLGLLTGFLFTPLFAIILVCVVAGQIGDRVTQRVISIANLLATVILLAFLLLYGLDIVQLRADLPEGDRLPFYMSAVRALAKYLFFIPAFLWLGVAGFKASRAPKVVRNSRHGEMAPLVGSTAKS